MRRSTMKGSWAVVLALTSALGLVAAACGDDDGGGDDGSGTTQVRLILGWVASPQFGGFFAAQQQGYYEEVGLEVVLEGGEVESPIQVVAAGGAEFGFGDADELLQARSQGIPIVGVLATFQKALRILTYHEEEPVTSFESLDGRDVYVDLGDAWWEFVKVKYSLNDVRERSYSQQAFLRDDAAVIQGYAGDQLELSSADPSAELGVLNVADSGWNPYMQVLFVSESYGEENSDRIRDFIDASVRGWEYYQENFHDVHVYMQDQGAEADPEVMDQIAELYEEYIFEGGFPAEMDAGRWQDTLKALQLTGVLDEDVDVSAAFSNEYLPS